MVYLKYPPDTLSILPHCGERNIPCGCGREFTRKNDLNGLNMILKSLICPKIKVQNKKSHAEFLEKSKT